MQGTDAAATARPVRVLISDDSFFIRATLKRMLEAAEGIEVVGVAADGREAVEKVQALRPDVVTMDVEMPVLDGIAALRRIMDECPTPVLMLSALTEEGAAATLEALDAGAVDFLPKGLERGMSDIGRIRESLVRKVRACAAVPRRLLSPAGDADRPRTAAATLGRGRTRLVAVGASTGGPQAVQRVLTGLPSDLDAAVLVAQHMPVEFTGPFARRLDRLCPLHVAEAADGELVGSGEVRIAPGDRHLIVEPGGAGRVRLRLRREPLDAAFRPCVDLLLSSAGRALGRASLAVVLTGMGCDGLEGARRLKECGGTVVAQDAETSVVYGMPRAVVEAGIADRILPLDRIAPAVAHAAGRTMRGRVPGGGRNANPHRA